MTFDELLSDLTVKGIIDGNLNERLYVAHRAEISYLTAKKPAKNADRFNDYHDAHDAFKREVCDICQQRQEGCRSCKYNHTLASHSCFAEWLIDEVFYNWYTQKKKGEK
jgi:hypothetical protein